MTDRYDTIVIGAGPSGATAARTLAQHGKKVLLLEKGHFPDREKACGGMLPLSAFQDFNLDRSTIETILTEEAFIFPWGRRVEPQTIVTVQRKNFDASCAFQAREAGAELLEGARVRKITRQGNLQIVQVQDNTGWCEFETPLIIFADGALTMANSYAGIGFRNTGKNVCVGFEYAFDAPANNQKQYSIFFDLPQFSPFWGYAWIFPNKDRLNAGIFLPKDRLLSSPPMSTLLEKVIEDPGSGELGDLLRGKTVLKKIGAHIPMEVASSLCADGAMVIGDAAGLIFPITAGGIGIALWSGRMAANAAARALAKNDCSKKQLLDYERAVKRSRVYKELRKQAFLYKFQREASKYTRFSYSKIFQVYKLKSEINLIDKMKVLIN